MRLEERTGREAGDAQGRGTGLSVVVGASLVLVGLWIGLRPLGDNTFLTHLATGRLIFADGIPTTDPYSYTAAGEPWVVQSWLASVLYAGAEQVGGIGAVRVLMGLLTAVLAGLAWLLTREAGSLVVRVASVALVLGIGAYTWSTRPLLFGLVFLCLTYLAADRVLPAWILLPAYWLWVNTHGSFPLGLVLLGALVVGRLLDRERPTIELQGLKWAAAGTLLGAVNPLGVDLLTFPVHMLGRQDVLSNIIEWQPPSADRVWVRLFGVLVVLAVVALVRRPSWRVGVPTLVFVGSAFLAARNVPVASLVLLPGIAHGFAGVGSLDGRRPVRAAPVALGALGVLALLLVVTQLREPDYEFEDFPVDAVAFLDAEGVMAEPSRHIAAADTTGNYLELLYGTDARVFIDDRLDMYPSGLVEDYLRLRDGLPGWEAVLERYDVDLIVWRADGPLAEALASDPRWRLTFVDAGWVVYERRAR